MTAKKIVETKVPKRSAAKPQQEMPVQRISPGRLYSMVQPVIEEVAGQVMRRDIDGARATELLVEYITTLQLVDPNSVRVLMTYVRGYYDAWLKGISNVQGLSLPDTLPVPSPAFAPALSTPKRNSRNGSGTLRARIAGL